MASRLMAVMLDHTLGRLALSVLAGLVGWMAGTLAYFALLLVTFNPPEEGDIHVGAFPMGLLGLAIAVRFARRWIKRARRVNPPTA
jgi:hypothetical protein